MPVSLQQALDASPTRHERARTCLFFARLFRSAPTPELLQQDADRAKAIAVEYARLFAVPGEQAVRPYESAYCDALALDTSTACSPYFDPDPPHTGLHGFLYGPSAVAVREEYHRAGFELDPAAHELPDHLAVEMEFMGRLLECGECEEAKAFFSEHLGRWVFLCLEEIKQKSGEGFYRAIADALAMTLRDGFAALTGC